MLFDVLIELMGRVVYGVLGHTLANLGKQNRTGWLRLLWGLSIAFGCVTPGY